MICVKSCNSETVVCIAVMLSSRCILYSVVGHIVYACILLYSVVSHVECVRLMQGDHLPDSRDSYALVHVRDL